MATLLHTAAFIFGAPALNPIGIRYEQHGKAPKHSIVSTVSALLGSFYAQKHAMFKVERGTLVDWAITGQEKHRETVRVLQTNAGQKETSPHSR